MSTHPPSPAKEASHARPLLTWAIFTSTITMGLMTFAVAARIIAKAFVVKRLHLEDCESPPLGSWMRGLTHDRCFDIGPGTRWRAESLHPEADGSVGWRRRLDGPVSFRSSLWTGTPYTRRAGRRPFSVPLRESAHPRSITSG